MTQPANLANPAPPSPRARWNPQMYRWVRLGLLTLFASFFYVALEWLFMVTKPSYMDPFPPLTRIAILFLNGLALFGLCLPLILLLFATGQLFRNPSARNWVFLIAVSVPALIFAAAVFMEADNFTYTIFHFGVITSAGVQRAVYGFLFLLLAAGIFILLKRALSHGNRWNRSLFARLLAGGLILILSIPSGIILTQDDDVAGGIPATNSADTHPNILLIGSDALNADHLSLYGYAQDTTPFLRTFADQALVSLNNFPNASISAGSFASIFTGKLPTDTHVLYPPDILQGKDAYEHFPGILKSEGYFNVEVGVNWYADANQFNLQNGFDVVNGVTSGGVGSPVITHTVLPDEAAYSFSAMEQRLTERLGHSFFLKPAVNSYALVHDDPSAIDDQARVDEIISRFENARQPLFLQAYLMGTHLNSPDMYDTSIRAFDGYFKQVIDYLSRSGKLDQTVVIVYSDHGYNDVSDVRIPLLIRFPAGAYAGKITHNTQNIDIAPTILDYLGITPPAWMSGHSLIQGEPDINRPIFSSTPNFLIGNEFNQLQLDLSKVKPPFYQFGIIRMIVCQNAYSLDTSQRTLQVQPISGYPTPCEPGSLPDVNQAKQLIISQLRADGFDVQSIETAIGQTEGN